MFPSLGSQYQFIKKIGSGGAGEVNLAVDLHSGYLVAIKTLFTDHLENEDILTKFKTEANIYLMLDHPNIVKLKNFIIKDGVPHLVQEYIEGQTLDNYIKMETGPIPPKKCIEIMSKIISAINYAHNKKIPIDGYDGVLHLDLKPGNVLIGSSGDIKIIDYGISQGSNQERSRKIMGSPMYMAPEQLDVNKKLDARTDVYALGVLLHFILTASKPYAKPPTLDSLFDHINNSPLLRTQSLYPGVDQRFQKIIDRSTSKKPQDRYQNCSELFNAIQQIS